MTTLTHSLVSPVSASSSSSSLLRFHDWCWCRGVETQRGRVEYVEWLSLKYHALLEGWFRHRSKRVLAGSTTLRTKHYGGGGCDWWETNEGPALKTEILPSVITRRNVLLEPFDQHTCKRRLVSVMLRFWHEIAHKRVQTPPTTNFLSHRHLFKCWYFRSN